VTPAAVAITKSDLVEDDWLELVVEDLRTALEPTTFRNAPLIPVSVVTAQGLQELKDTLKAVAQTSVTRSADDPFFRLPIDRVFTVRGTGTVVTGTVWSGSTVADHYARLLPSGREVRIRSLQRQSESVDSVQAGERAALALNGVAHNEISRGETLVTSKVWSSARQLTAHVRVLPDVSWSLRTRQRVHLHLGTSMVTARLRLLEVDVLEPGDEGWVLLRLEEPLLARAGDPFILRSFSPVTTVAGGVVYEWDVKPYRRRAAQLPLIEKLRTAATQLDALTGLRGWEGIALEEVPLHLVAQADAALYPQSGGRVFHPDLLRITQDAMCAGLTELHQQFPLRNAIEMAALRRTAPARAPAPLRELAERELVRSGRAEFRPGGVALVEWQPQFTPEVQTRIESLLAQIDAAGITMLDPGDLPDAATLRELLNLLENQGRIVQVVQHGYSSRSYLDNIALALQDALASGARAPGELGAALGLSRKQLIPLLEYFDHRGLTRRVGDQRVLAASTATGA
jgi:selenocysteine-specific elongation factor